MAVSVQFSEVSSVPDATTYRVTWTVTSATDVSDSIFLHDTLSRTFIRVCRPDDLSFPTTPTPSSAAFYRSASAVGNYSSIAQANQQKTAVRTAVEALVDAQQVLLASFIGTVEHTVPEE